MLEVFDCEQGSPEWFACRLGIPTASMFATILATGADGRGRRTYMHKLAGEIITGQLADNYSNAHMERGHAMEPEARTVYELISGNEAVRVGFIRNGRVGASPDSLIGTRGLLELKTKLPHLLIAVMLRGEAPAEHMAQVQGQLWISEREWNDLACYWPGMPLVTFRVERDENYILRLARAVAAFNEELDEVVARVRAYGDPGALRRSLEQSVA